MDAQLKREIAQVVNEATREAYLLYNEEWLNARQLCEQFQMIPKSWLKTHRHLLPQSSVRYLDDNGNEKVTNPAFPKHRINQMIIEGKLDFTRQECQYRHK